MDYQSLYLKTVVELRQMAKAMNVRLPSHANKQHIIELLLNANGQAQSAGKAAETKVKQTDGAKANKAPEKAQEDGKAAETAGKTAAVAKVSKAPGGNEAVEVPQETVQASRGSEKAQDDGKAAEITVAEVAVAKVAKALEKAQDGSKAAEAAGNEKIPEQAEAVAKVVAVQKNTGEAKTSGKNRDAAKATGTFEKSAEKMVINAMKASPEKDSAPAKARAVVKKAEPSDSTPNREGKEALASSPLSEPAIAGDGVNADLGEKPVEKRAGEWAGQRTRPGQMRMAANPQIIDRRKPVRSHSDRIGGRQHGENRMGQGMRPHGQENGTPATNGPRFNGSVGLRPGHLAGENPSVSGHRAVNEVNSRPADRENPGALNNGYRPGMNAAMRVSDQDGGNAFNAPGRTYYGPARRENGYDNPSPVAAQTPVSPRYERRTENNPGRYFTRQDGFQGRMTPNDNDDASLRPWRVPGEETGMARRNYAMEKGPDSRSGDWDDREWNRSEAREYPGRTGGEYSTCNRLDNGRNRREGYYNEVYKTSNPAVPEMLAAGECTEGAGVLDIQPDGYGFLRAENYQQGDRDVYISIAQIRRFNLRMGDYVVGQTRSQREGDRYTAMMYITSVNGQPPEKMIGRKRFDELIPVYPQERLRLEQPGENDLSLRIIDMLAPIGKGQRGLIASRPKAGKTTLLKKLANAITSAHPEIHLMVLLIDERPEEVTDMKRSIQGEVVYSTFDEPPESHAQVSEMVLERAQRLVEMGKDVVILMDSITRLARAYNLVIPPTGRSLSGGLDPGALHKPKRFFGAARNIENGGSLTVIATALVDTGSRMDDIIYEEFKGTGNMELHLDRKLSDRRIFPAVDMVRSGTRREELLLTETELEGAYRVRRMLPNGSDQPGETEKIIALMEKTATNVEFFQRLSAYKNVYEKSGFSIGKDNGGNK